MSNRRRLRRGPRRMTYAIGSPAGVLAFADGYRCPDCSSEFGPLQWDAGRGMWSRAVHHDDECPWLTGLAGGAV